MATLTVSFTHLYKCLDTFRCCIPTNYILKWKLFNFDQPREVWKMIIPKWVSRWWQLKMVLIFLKCVWSIFRAVALKLLVRFWFWQQYVSGQWNFPQVVIFKFCFISYCSLTSLRNLKFILIDFEVRSWLVTELSRLGWQANRVVP